MDGDVVRDVHTGAGIQRGTHKFGQGHSYGRDMWAALIFRVKSFRKGAVH